MQLIDDRYELLEVIASGGMATVWRARDTRLDRLVAVKRAHPAPPGDNADGRMAREARAAASISHPNVITVYDFGSDESGPYLVMELVDGPTLVELGSEIDEVQAVDIGSQLADALASIHAAGIVHRDVKPGNVIMSERGPLLTDFGIALDPDASKITAPGKVVATPSYAAPEVLAGEEPTVASDVFSLAATIDELIRNSGSAPSRDIEAALRSAGSVSPEDRPDAADFGAALRRAAPTATLASGGDSTLVLEPSAPRRGDDETDAPRRSLPMWMWATGALTVLAVGLAVIGLALSDSDTPADAARVPSTATTLVAETTTTSIPTTTTTTSLQSAVAQARDELEGVLLQTPRSDLNPPEAEDLMKKVDEAIAAADGGDPDEAEKKLSEVVEKLDDKVEGETLDEATLILEQLAILLGVDLNREDKDDRDD